MWREHVVDDSRVLSWHPCDLLYESFVLPPALIDPQYVLPRFRSMASRQREMHAQLQEAREQRAALERRVAELSELASGKIQRGQTDLLVALEKAR